MKYTLPFIVLVCATLFVACNRNDAPQAFPWPKTGTEADSISRRLDRNLFLRADSSVLRPDVERIESIAQAVGTERLQLRARYYRGHYLYRAGNQPLAQQIFDSLLVDIDSAVYPYLWHRTYFMAKDFVNRTPEAYREIKSQADYYASAGDSFMEAALLTSLGNFVKDCGDPSSAFELYHRADSLYRATGFDEIALGNTINMASATFVDGDTVKAVEILKRVLADPATRHNTRIRDIALSNLGAYACEREPFDTLYSWYGYDNVSRVITYLSMFLTEDGDIDSALVMGRHALNIALDEGEADGVALAMYALSHAFEADNQLDSAFMYMQAADDVTGGMIKAKQADVIRNSETLRIVAERKMEAELARSKSMLWVAAWGFVVFIVLLLAAWMVYVRVQKLRLARVNAELETEKARRRLLATQIAVEEKDSLLSTVSREMSSLKDSGEISPEVSGRIGSSIKAHLAVSTSRDSFIDAFSELHPDFGTRLREKYPAVKDYDVKLASLIALGLDNKQIASTLGIRHESVKQARWRLRSRMGLAAGESLDHILADLLRMQ